MNEVLKNLWSQITSASGPVKVALGSCGLLLALVTSVMVWRAQNPHFVVLAADLDSHSFNGAVKALAEAGIRYETSVGGPPYVIQVESGRRHEAIAAMHVSGEFLDDARGISSGLEGSSAVFLGQSERHQRTQKRMWEEVELSLEKLNFVSKAKVTVSGSPTSTLASLRKDARRASVIVTLRGMAKPTATETRALVGLVRGGTGVTDERMTIVDQHSNVLFDGGERVGTQKHRGGARGAAGGQEVGGAADDGRRRAQQRAAAPAGERGGRVERPAGPLVVFGRRVQRRQHDDGDVQLCDERERRAAGQRARQVGDGVPAEGDRGDGERHERAARRPRARERPVRRGGRADGGEVRARLS